MRIVITQTADEAGRQVAVDIVDRMAARAFRVLGVATGATPLPVYRELARRAPAHALLELVALDEYVGVSASDPRSFGAYVARHIAAPLGVPPERVHVPDGAAPDPHTEATAFEKVIDRIGPVDLQILGVGTNGHVGFNEPGSTPSSTTRVVELTEHTRRDNAPSFAGAEVPAKAITQGVSTILRARTLIVVATGRRKAAAVAALARGLVVDDLPVTFLAQHADLTLVADAAAGSLIDA